MMGSASVSAADVYQVRDLGTDSELNDCPDDLSEWSAAFEDAKSNADRPHEGQPGGKSELQRESHSQEGQVMEDLPPSLIESSLGQTSASLQDPATPAQQQKPRNKKSLSLSTSTQVRRSARNTDRVIDYAAMASPIMSVGSDLQPLVKIVVLKIPGAILKTLTEGEQLTIDVSACSSPNKRKCELQDVLSPTEKRIRTTEERTAEDSEIYLSTSSAVNEVPASINAEEPSQSLTEWSSPSHSPFHKHSDKNSPIGSVPRSNVLWSIAEQLDPPLAKKGTETIKPEPREQPSIWAQRRFDLCETLPYFRAHKGGYQGNDSFARSFLLAGSPYKRDYLDGSVSMCRASGGMVHDKTTKKMAMISDQKEGRSTQCLKNNMRRYNPVVLIATASSPLLSSRAPHPYCVMDYFMPTHIWWEKTKERKKDILFLRYRFERLNSSGESAWWQPVGTVELAVPGTLEKPFVYACPSCRESFQQIYLAGWMCLEPRCAAFWKLITPSGELQEPEEETLMYDPRFLKQKTYWPNAHHQLSLFPRSISLNESSSSEEFYSTEAWKGIVCPQCGSCVARRWWKGWLCETQGCGYERTPAPRVIPALALANPYQPLTENYMPTRDYVSNRIRVSEPLWAHNYRIDRYTVPGINSFVCHLVANETVNREAGGPNDMFEELQRVDIKLERRILGSENHKDPSYTRHLNVNFGAPYKFVASGRARTFEEAEAKSVSDARSRLNWAAKLVRSLHQGKSIEEVSKEWKPVEFNEVLALGYFEDQKINYHDDGEAGVGPSIATLSLGDTGTMRIRMKAKHYHGVTATGVYNYKHEAIPGCKNYHERLAAHNEILENAPKTGREAYFKDAAKKLCLKLGAAPEADIVLVLGHGDIVIMDGAPLQTYYEHSVSHEGRHPRFALTARYIDINTMVTKDKARFEIRPDLGSYDGSRLPLPKDHNGKPIENGTKFVDMDGDQDAEAAAEEVVQGEEAGDY